MNKLKTLIATSVALISTLSVSGQIAKADTYYNQDVTCYISEVGNYFASGKTPYSGGVAVHPKYFYTNDWNEPIYNFGSIIISNRTIDVPMPGYSYPEYPRILRYFYVEDTGELNNEHSLTSNWFDIWAGTYPKGTSKTNSSLCWFVKNMDAY